MANQWDSIAAAKQGADQPLCLNAEHVDGCDDAESLEMDRMAEILVRRGVERRLAMKCAGDLYESQAAMDRQCAGAVGEAAPTFLSHGEGDKEMALASVRTMALRLVQAPKPRFSAGCLLLAMGAKSPGVTSAREWAKQQNVSHELAANEVETWSDVIALPPTHDRKTEAQKKIYRDTNGRKRRAT